MLTFYNRERYNEEIDAFNELSSLEILKNGTGDDALQGMSTLTRSDITWRANHVNMQVDYWDMIKANLPYPLAAQIIGNQGPLSQKDLLTRQEPQALSILPHFTNAILAVSRLRFFHRTDGKATPPVITRPALL